MGNNNSTVILLILLIVLIVSALLVVVFKLANNKKFLYRRLFYRGKRAERTNHNDTIGHILAPSILGIALCTFCLCGTSWAWFTVTLTSGTAKIQTATYTVQVMAKQGETAISGNTENSGITKFTLEAGKSYNIKLTPTGTATSGFCKVTFENVDYYTEQLATGFISFVAHASQNSILIITPEWGICAVADKSNTIKAGTEIGQIRTPPNSPTVESEAPVITEETPPVTEPGDAPPKTTEPEVQPEAPVTTEETPQNSSILNQQNYSKFGVINVRIDGIAGNSHTVAVRGEPRTQKKLFNT
ncbi:MAG: hypothetical protein RSD88_06625 [Anaerovoracaceae bacterium]